jgi:hypothetical protein
VILAAIVLHVACILVIWALEVSCDLGAAADAGPAAMMDVFELMAASVRLCSRAASVPRRLAENLLHWAAGPRHRPIPVRRTIIKARYLRHPISHAGSRVGFPRSQGPTPACRDRPCRLYLFLFTTGRSTPVI